MLDFALGFFMLVACILAIVLGIIVLMAVFSNPLFWKVGTALAISMFFIIVIMVIKGDQ